MARRRTDGSGSGPSLIEFYETTELGGQIDNWCGPNIKCLLAMCRSAGFARVRLEGVVAGRARVTCRRHWEPPDPHPSQPAPWIHAAINNRTNDIYFHHGKDEYVCVYFKTPERDLTLDRIRVEVDGYGVPSLVLADLGRDGWQANFRIPPWLEPGPHEVRVRTVQSPLSDVYRIEKRMKYEPDVRAGRRRRRRSPAGKRRRTGSGADPLGEQRHGDAGCSVATATSTSSAGSPRRRRVSHARMSSSRSTGPRSLCCSSPTSAMAPGKPTPACPRN